MSAPRINSTKTPCPRCGEDTTTIPQKRGQHMSICNKLPLPHELRAEKERDKLTYKEIAARYNVSAKFMTRRCRIGQKRKKVKRYNFTSPNHCKNCGIGFHVDPAVGAVCGTCYHGNHDHRPKEKSYHPQREYKFNW